MEKKVYTINIDDEIVVAEAKNSKAKTTKTLSKVAVFGVEEINNASAAKRMKNKAEKGSIRTKIRVKTEDRSYGERVK